MSASQHGSHSARTARSHRPLVAPLLVATTLAATVVPWPARGAPATAPPSAGAYASPRAAAAEPRSALAVVGRAFSVVGLLGTCVGLAVVAVGVIEPEQRCVGGACSVTSKSDLLTAGAVTTSLGGAALLSGMLMTYFGTATGPAPRLAGAPGGLGLAWDF